MGESVHFGVDLLYSTFLVGRESGGSHGKASAYNAGDPGSIPVLEVPLEKDIETHSSILAWRIPWTEKSGGVQSIGSQRVRHNPCN